ncbi:MAG: archease [Elusimicrobia bacterium]|nr:archease [Elusimicrobiota bacterium]
MEPFELFDHTADVGLIARGADLPSLFRHAAQGLTSLLVDPATVLPGGIRERVRVQAPDKEGLLVNWLNEVLFLFNVQQMVFSRFDVRSFSETGLEAEGEGELLDPGRHSVLREVKAATFHDLQIRRTEQGWEAKIVLDV